MASGAFDILTAMKSVSTKTYALDAVGVNALIEALTAFFGEQRLDRRTVVRARLVAEELLLCVMAHEEAPETCTLTVGTCFGGAFAEICYGGAPIDPTASADEWSARLLANLRLTPVWSFRAGANTLRLRVRRPSGRKDLLRLAAAAVAAGVLGALGGVLPAAVVSGISELLLLPLFNAFVGLIATLAGPLILFTVASGVFRIGDTKLLQKAGTLMFSRYLLITLACSLFSTLAASRVFPLTAAPSSGEAQLSAISQLLFDILPSNPVAPFLNANMMQIVVLSIFLGVVLLLLGERAGTVACFVEESAWVLQAMMEQVCRLIPLFVFAALLRMIWSGAAARLLDFWKPFALFLALLACAFAAALVTTALRTKTPVLLLL